MREYMRAVAYAVAALCFIATAFVVGDSKAEEPAMNEAKLKAVQIARDYVATRWPDFDLAGRPPIVYDRAEFWQVEYELPASYLGGTPTLSIDKKTLKVLRAYRQQ